MMSEENSCPIPRLSKRFPKILDGKINTIEFLEASKSFIIIYDSLGAAFYAVKKDVSGNIDKLTKVYNKDPPKYTTLNDLILNEKDDPTIFAVDALVWLKRALEFTAIFIRDLAEDPTKNENITPFASSAYEKALKKHHNWLIQNVFKMVLRALPARSDFVKAISEGCPKEVTEEDIVKEVTTFLNGLDDNVKRITSLYDELEVKL